MLVLVQVIDPESAWSMVTVSGSFCLTGFTARDCQDAVANGELRVECHGAPAERRNRADEHGFQTLPLADFPRQDPRHPHVGQTSHRAQRLLDTFV